MLLFLFAHSGMVGESFKTMKTRTICKGQRSGKTNKTKKKPKKHEF